MRFFKRLSAVLCVVLLGFTAQGVAADQLIISHTNIHGYTHTNIQNSPGGSGQSSYVQIHWRGKNVRVGFPKALPVPEPRSQMVVVDKLATYWVKPPHGMGRIRITVPVRYYLSSWDVQALERELERLGVKVKPRPIPPKPGPVSG